MHFSMRCSHCSKHALNSSSITLLSVAIKFFWMSSMLWKRWTLRVFLILQNFKKSHIARSGEYGGWSNTFTQFFAKKSRILKAEWTDALSWWNNQELFAHNSSQTWQICSQRRRRIFKYHSAFIVIFWGGNSLWITPFLSKNAISIIFTCDFDFRVFLSLASPSLTHCIFWRLVSGSHLKSHDLSLVITHSRMFSDSVASSQSRQTSTQHFFCSSVRFFGTSLAQSFRRHNSSFTIKQMVLWLIDSSSVTSLMGKWWSESSSCFTCST